MRKAGARIRLISDGDVAGVIATSRPDSGIDIYMGIGGAPEGVLAAAALRCIGGQFQGRLHVPQRRGAGPRPHAWAIDDLDRIYNLEDLAQGDVMFAATGVTDGTMLEGVRRRRPAGSTPSRSSCARKTGTVRIIEAEHNLPVKGGVVPHFPG